MIGLLAIDSGNTNIVFGVFDGDEFVKAFRCANDPKRTADEYIVWLSELMKLNGLDAGAITGTVIGSVVPETAFNLISLCRRYFPGEPVVIGDPKVTLGNEALIERPEQVGADLLRPSISRWRRFIWRRRSCRWSKSRPRRPISGRRPNPPCSPASSGAMSA